MKIRKGDTVLIISGKDRGRKGKVIRALPKKGKIVVEGINIRKKHVRPRREGEKGQIVEIPAPLDVSNVKLICPKCGKPTRIGYKIIDLKTQPSTGLRWESKTQKPARESKIRICKKCGKEI